MTTLPAGRDPRTAFRLVTVGLGLAAALPGCAHRPGAEPAPLSASARRFVEEADALAQPRFEEEFLEARLLYQALPPSDARLRLRSRLFAYLLDPLSGISAGDLRAEGLSGASADAQLLSSLQEAMHLCSAEELAQTGDRSLSGPERGKLLVAARLVRAVFSPRGAENETALALALLAELDASATARAQYAAQLDALLSWTEDGRALATGESGLEGPPSARQVLESVMEHWPSPAVVRRLADSYVARQQRLSRLLRRPMGGGAQKGGFGEFLLRESDGLASTALSLAAVFLRAGQTEEAARAVGALAGQPGDDAPLRQLLAPFASSGAPDEAAYLKLARRYLPRVPLLDGTASEETDPVAAMEVLRRGLQRYPQHTELLLLGSRVARLVNSPVLGLRLLEEAEPLLIAGGADRATLEKHSRELFELAFGLLRVHSDPEDLGPTERAAADYRKRLVGARARFGRDADWLAERPLELELARNYVDAGSPDRAIDTYAKVSASDDVDITLQAGTLWLRTGDTARAVRTLRDALEQHKPGNAANETIGFVEGHSKLARALGQAYESSGRPDEASESFRMALRGWERLMIEHMRRRNQNAAAEATFEVGRLYYLLGRRAEGIQKFNEGIALAEGRDQSYIDPLAFLVQRGELDAVLDIFRAAISRQGDAVSEYVKVYASLWVQDLVRRGGRPPEPSAEAYLHYLAHRKVHLRPLRSATWYVMLARHAVGKVTYDELLAQATTTGRKAELFFYEAMRRLADGKTEDAHSLWTRVLETRMFSFFEYEMAARYIRQGAPSAPAEKPAESAETI